MGYIRNHAIVVTSWNKSHVKQAWDKANELFLKHFGDTLTGYGHCIVTPIVGYVINDGASFLIAPDGSKEGWTHSYCGDAFRKEFLDWISTDKDNYCDYIELSFGGDDTQDHILRSKFIDEKSFD